MHHAFSQWCAPIAHISCLWRVHSSPLYWHWQLKGLEVGSMPPLSPHTHTKKPVTIQENLATTQLTSYWATTHAAITYKQVGWCMVDLAWFWLLLHFRRFRASFYRQNVMRMKRLLAHLHSDLMGDIFLDERTRWHFHLTHSMEIFILLLSLLLLIMMVMMMI